MRQYLMLLKQKNKDIGYVRGKFITKVL